MANYRVVSFDVDAFFYIPGHVWPQWLKDALDEGSIYRDASRKLYCRFGVLRLPVRSRDWIVKEPSGKLYPISEDRFPSRFKKI